MCFLFVMLIIDCGVYVGGCLSVLEFVCVLSCLCVNVCNCFIYGENVLKEIMIDNGDRIIREWFIWGYIV